MAKSQEQYIVLMLLMDYTCL